MNVPHHTDKQAAPAHPVAPDAVGPAADSVADSGATAEYVARDGQGQSPTISLAETGTVERSGHESTKQAVRPAIAGYEILGELGRGGMGVVYRARQKGLGRLVAIKMLLAGEHAGPEHLARFQVEAQAVASLQHPNIVQIYEVGEHQGLPFFSLEFVPGGSLSQKCARQPQLPADSARLVETIARAMHVAHQLNIVHRDLKPANILLAFGDHSSASAITMDASRQKLLAEGPLRAAVPKIADFGLAKRLEIDSSQTRSGTIMGSPSYMAPEQARGDTHDIGPLVDVYAIGTILYELLTGRPPFLAATAIDTLQQVLKTEPVPPSRLEPKLPRDLETICLKCLQKEPLKRYASAEALAEDLQRFQQGEPILARPVSSGERAWRWCRRNPWLASASAAAVALLVTTATVSLWSAVTLKAKNTTIAQEKEVAVKAQREAQREAANAAAQQVIAEQKAFEADEARGIADANATLASEQAKLASEQAKIASEQATLAVRTIQLVVQKIQQQLSEAPGTQAVRKEILDLASAEIVRVANKVDASTSKEATQLAIHRQLGLVFKELGESEKSFEQFSKAESIARERIVIKQGSDASRTNLALVLIELGEIGLEYRRDLPLALKYYEEVVATYTEILNHPHAGDGTAAQPFAVKLSLAEGYMRVAATIYRNGNPAGAMAWFQRGLDLRRELSAAVPGDPDLAKLSEQVRRMQVELPLQLDLSRSLLAVGDVSFRLRDMSSATQFYGEGLAMREKLVADVPKILGLKHELARTYGNFGEIYQFAGEATAAKEHFDRNLALMEELARIDAKSVAYQRDLALSYYRLGSHALRAGDRDAARTQFERAREIRQSLAERNLLNDRRQMEWMLTLAHCGDHSQAATIAQKYARVESADNEMLLDVARSYAQCVAAASDDDELRSRYAEQSISALTTAVNHGYRDAVYLESEPDLDPLRDRDAFKSLLKHAGENSPPVAADGRQPN